MRIHTFSAAAALALSLTCSATLFAAEPSAYDRCLELGQADEFDQAEPFCLQASRESQEGMRLYGDFLDAKGDYEGAVEAYTKTYEYQDGDPDEAFSALARRAYVRFELKQYSAALKDALASLEHWPEDSELWLLASRAEPNDAKRLGYVERAIKADPDELMPRLAYTHLLLEAGKAKEAIASADAALKLDPKDATAQFLRGQAYLAAGEHAKADKQFKTLARAHPEDYFVKTGQAQVALALKRYDDAIKHATAALEHTPEHSEALEARAKAHLAMGNPGPALTDIGTGLRIKASWAADLRKQANELIVAHAAFTPKGFAEREQDRKTTFDFLNQDMRRTCGTYNVPKFDVSLDTDEFNERLTKYYECLRRWANDLNNSNNAPKNVSYAIDRLHDAQSVIARARDLRCSQMPKRSNCIADDLYERAGAVFEGTAQPILYVYRAETDRLNADIDQFNRAVKRHDTVRGVADFLNELGRALNE